ncbi:MAG: signal peptidase I [Verrucomicrobiota bacterium]
MRPPASKPPPATPAARKPFYSLLASLLISGGAFWVAGRYRAFLAWMLPLTGGGLVLIGLWDTPGTLPLPVLYALSAVWLVAWLIMLAVSSRQPFAWHPPRLVLLLLVGVTLHQVCLRQAGGWFGGFNVDTNSKAPTLLGPEIGPDGKWTRPWDSVVADYLTYRHRRPLRGEMVVFWPSAVPAELPEEIKNAFVKRVVGLPGERVRIDPPYIYINDEVLTDPPVFQKWSAGRGGFDPPTFTRPIFPELEPFPLASPEDEVILGPDEYFVLNDSPRARYNDRPTLDSRHFGPLKGDAFFGRILYIVHPPGRRGWVE